jgi:hypothetical protein
MEDLGGRDPALDRPLADALAAGPWYHRPS